MKIFRLIICFAAAAALLCSCGSNKYESRSFVAMDTYITLKAQCGAELLDEVKAEAERIDGIFDCHNPSELSSLNENGTAQTSDELAEVISRALEFARQTDGAFNPAVYALGEIWDIGGDSALPSPSEVADALERCDFNAVSVRGNSISLGGARLDLGGIAKGYASQRAADKLRESGVKNAVLSFGGNIALVGDKGGAGFTVAIQHPRKDSGESIGVLNAADCFVVTSGDYQRYKTVGGVRYHHIFGRDGYPTDNGLISATAVYRDGAAADAYSTAMMVMGAARAREFADSTDGLDAILITDDKKVIVTDGIRDKFKLTAEDYSYAD